MKIVEQKKNNQSDRETRRGINILLRLHRLPVLFPRGAGGGREMEIREKINRFAVALLDTLDADGIIESYAVLAAEKVGLVGSDATLAIDLLIEGGLLERTGGPKLVPGKKWEQVKNATIAHKGGGR